jgi:hypothetical protein
MWNTSEWEIEDLFVGSPQIGALTQQQDLAAEWARRQLAESAARRSSSDRAPAGSPLWLERQAASASRAPDA